MTRLGLFATVVGALAVEPDVAQPRLWLEGRGVPTELASTLEGAARLIATGPPAVRLGTLWPRPRLVGVVCDAAGARILQGAFERYALPELADHLHAFDGDQWLFSWFDVPGRDLTFAERVPPALVRRLKALVI